MSDKLIRPPSAAAPPPRVPYDDRVLEHPDDEVLDVHELLSVLRRDAWLVLVLGVLCVGAVYYLTRRSQAQYRAEALIRVRDTQAQVAGGLMPGGEPRQGSMEAKADRLSEMLVLQGRQVAAAVVDREGLRLFDSELDAPSPLATDVQIALPANGERLVSVSFGTFAVIATSRGRSARAAYGLPLELDSLRFTIARRPAIPERTLRIVSREEAVDWLIGVLSAQPKEGTDAVIVSATTQSRHLAIRVVNATIEQYQWVNAARARESQRRRREFLVARLRETDDSLIAAQTVLGRFRIRTGVYGAREQFQAERSGATEAERQLKHILTEQRLRRSLLAQLDRSSNPTQSAPFRTLLASPDVTANPVVSHLYARLTELQTKRDELLAAGRTAEHPDVREVETLLAPTEKQMLDALHNQVNSLDSRVAALGDVREHATAEVVRLTPTEAEEVRLNEQVEAMRGVGSMLRGELQKTRLAEAAEMGQVEIVDRATRALPLSGGRPMKLALALAFGLLVGTAIALLRAYLDTRLHRRGEVEQMLRVPGLAIIPRLRPAANGSRYLHRRNGQAGSTHRDGLSAGAVLPELVTVVDATDLAAGAYRALRTRILFGPRAKAALRSIVVTSAGAGEGKTTTAANLAVTLAQQGMRVLLVDCDLRHPRLHALFGRINTAGLTDVLLAQATPLQVIQPSGVERLSLLSSGPLIAGPIGPSDLIGSTNMTELLTTTTEKFDIVVLDTPPVLLASDAFILAARADGVLLVLRAGSTTRTLALDAVQQLVAVGATVIGAVLNDPDAKTPKYEEYSHQSAR